MQRVEERFISNKQLKEFLEQVMQDFQLYGPVKDGDIISFKKINSIDEICFEYRLTTKPLKELFFPQVQALFSYKQKKYQTDIIQQQSPNMQKRVVFGVRPCDAQSLIVLDKVFLQDPPYNFYLSLRNNTIVISLACNSYANTCFCDSVGVVPGGSENSDIFLTKIDNDYTIKTITTLGEELIKKYMPNLETISFELQPQFLGPLKMKIDILKLKAWLDINFTNSIWEEVASSCVGCAICTYLCPTCHCFDITDEVIKEEGKRFLVWDSCSFSSFTKTAASQPRFLQYQRFRQRIMHKFKYYWERFGVVACVGCGRCINFCPVNINIVEVVNELIKT